jgi:glycosyltransferase involved in cell wall biosynthesis
MTADSTDGRLRVLMSGYACGPGSGSEPGAGWMFASAAAQSGHDIWLLVEQYYRPAIEAALAARPLPRLHPVFVRTPMWVAYTSDDVRWNRARYAAWQRIAAREAARLHAELHFDVAHHVIMTGDWLPVGLCSLRDVPLIWGPVGGYAAPAWQLWRQMGLVNASKEVARLAITGAGRRIFGDRAAARASLVVAQNPEVAQRFGKARRVIVEPNVALDYSQLPARATERGDGPLTAVFAGRLLPWKGAWLAVETLSRPEAAGWRLKLYGDGPDRGALERQARARGVAERVTFAGVCPRDELLDHLARADAMLFPSLHDGAGWAVAEAVAIGCPVVCLDAAGPSYLVREGDGVRVPTHGDVAGALAKALAAVGRLDPPSIPFVRSDRFNVDRLPATLRGWYDAVADHPAERT